MNNTALAIQFFLQVAVILAVCRLVGYVARRCGQPQVVAEMIAGVALGPSFFGYWWPEAQQWLFPWDPSQTIRDSQSYLYPASQLGLALYMFIVGLEFRVEILRVRWRASVAVSLAGMLAPFLLGALLGAWMHAHTRLFSPQTERYAAMLFLGAALCITAFPMLARIIHFHGLAGTTMGTVALGAGAMDDACAWCLLAVVLAGFDESWHQALVTILGAVVFVTTAVLVLRRLLLRFRQYFLREEQLTDTGMALALAVMALMAWATDSLGLHTVFGAFVAGAIMPRGAIARQLAERLQPLTVALLLPLFFVYSGLNTRIGLLDTLEAWGLCALVLAAAIAGKGIACAAAAHWSGLRAPDALGVGILMNARGLMELIIINIGLERGVISPALFAMLVIMAVVTTLMTGPLFRLWVAPHRELDQCASGHPAPDVSSPTLPT
ncbi:MAG: potassium transporter [Pirellulaceae bacterium]|nr:MAG: potassium transporter [Pirellulaceae bacterium]